MEEAARTDAIGGEERLDVARTIAAVEETVHVDKVKVDRGGFRVTKGHETRTQVVDTLLSAERVEIERRAIGTPLAVGERPVTRQEGDTLVVPVVEEMLVTEKRLVLVEEVRITRVRDTRREVRHVPLKKEHIDIERLAADPSATGRS